jgi:hypothetical protein
MKNKSRVVVEVQQYELAGLFFGQADLDEDVR